MDSKTGFRHFGTMIDCSRNAVMSVEGLKRWVDILKSLDFNTLLLYTEDTYEVQNQPFFGYLRGRYTAEELKEIDDYAFSKGIEVIPCIQTLAHMNAIVRWPAYAPHVDIGDIMLAGDEAVYKLIDDIFASLSKSLRTRTANVGMDEAHMIGMGQYYDKYGPSDRKQIFLDHLNKVAEIAKKYGFEICMWSDMFFRLASSGDYYNAGAGISTSVAEQIPDNVRLIYWDYYSTDIKHYDHMIEAHEKIKKDTWFGGGLWTWVGHVAHNSYSMRATKSALTSCKSHGLNDVFLTMWGDDGGECSKFGMIPSLFYASEIAKGITKMSQIKSDFKEWCGISFDSFMLLDLPKTAGCTDRCIFNPEKYMLYNDCFMGIFDCTVREGMGAEYAACARRLALMKKNEKWGYLFKTMQALCEVLAIKCEIGIRTRAAYEAKDKAAMAIIIADYKKLIKKLEAFYNAYRDQWYYENKPHGFDIQDSRIGGLIQRVKNCEQRLELYCDGKIDRIEELEEKLLDVSGEEEFKKETLAYNSWRMSFTANVV